MTDRQPVTPTPPPPPPSPGVKVDVGGLSETERKILEETRISLKQLQDEFSIYRRDKGETERYTWTHV